MSCYESLEFNRAREPRTLPRGRSNLRGKMYWLGAHTNSQVQPAYFDSKSDSWILSSYADVVAALYCPELSLVGPAHKKDELIVDEDARLRMRLETREALSSTLLRSVRRQIFEDARAQLAGLDWAQPVDLIKDYAEPVCLALALQVTHPSCNDVDSLKQLAKTSLCLLLRTFRA